MARALYRQYRPKTFDEVLGQDRVTNVLKNQVKSHKFSHAYIFSGERGCGKTSCAKIFAKAINCLNPKDGSPCLECENCQAIEEETTIDVVEMDAASNRRIDDIRNLKDNVIYPPNMLKYKVYIIDEAHMITREAFNALLKIMEEPPSHLVFILATTEIEKIPKTILSRVQRFDFNKIDENKIKTQIDIILKDRNVKIEKEAIDLIIKKANGAMRDALSILDQVLSFENETYTLKDVEGILGVVDFYDVDKLSQAIIGKDSKTSLEMIFKLRDSNKTNKDILDSLMSYFNDIMIYSLTQSEEFFDNEERLDFIKERSKSLDDREISDYLDILIDYSNKIKLTDNTDVLTELCVLRLINLKNQQSIESRIVNLEKSNGIDLADEINKVVEYRLSNLDLSNVKASSNLKNQVTQQKESREESQDIVDKEPKISNDPIKGVKESAIEESKASVGNKSLESTLTKDKEARVKEMLLRTAGGVLNGLFNGEGFNYSISDNDFTMYINEDFYTIFIITKIDEINEKINEILGRSYKFHVESGVKEDNTEIEAKENIENKIEEKEELDQGQVDNSEKLKEVFGEDLIIE